MRPGSLLTAAVAAVVFANGALAQTQAARTIGAQSIGERSSPCQALNWVLSR